MEKYLRRCLDSLIIDEEGMKQLEVLVINDGSKDSSSQIAHEYQDKYPDTYRVIDKENGNYGSCINRGLKEATGKYVKVLDADDCYYNDNINGFLNILKSSEADILFTPYDIYSFDSLLQEKMTSLDVEDGKVFDLSSVQWTNNIEKNYRAMHCMAVSTKLLLINGYHQTEGISYTDTLFVFYSVLFANTCSFYSKPIYKYYLGRNAQTMSLASMKKSHMHFYKNARVMMDTYLQLPKDISDNKRYLLFTCMQTCFIIFSNISIGYIWNPRKEIKLIEELIKDSEKCKLECPLYIVSLKERLFYLWKELKVPPFVLYWMKHLYNTLCINKCRQ